MNTLTAVIITGCLSFMGCSYLQRHPDAYIKQSSVCIDNGWYGSHQDARCPDAVKTVAPDASHEKVSWIAALERDPLAGQSKVAKKQSSLLTSHICDFEQSLEDRDREMAIHHSGTADPATLSNQLSTRQSEVTWSQVETNRLAADLAAAKQSIIDLRLQLDQSNESRTKAERNLLKALQTEILKVECNEGLH